MPLLYRHLSHEQLYEKTWVMTFKVKIVWTWTRNESNIKLAAYTTYVSINIFKIFFIYIDILYILKASVQMVNVERDNIYF